MIERATVESRGVVGRTAAPSVRVLLFGRVRELAGTGETTVAVPTGATVASVADRLAAANPALTPHLRRCSFAVNAVYAQRDAPVRDGDEVAVIPPIGGG